MRQFYLNANQEKNLLGSFFTSSCPWFSHLLGYNHDNERDEKEMEELEVNYLSKLNIKNPYEIRG